MPDSPADTIRRAADLMRERAMAATPGPWVSLDGGDRLIHDPGHDLEPPIYVVDEPMSNAANAEHIAALHPIVTLRVADSWHALADEMADYPAVTVPLGVGIASRPNEPSNLWTHTYNAALAYLGEATGA